MAESSRIAPARRRSPRASRAPPSVARCTPWGATWDRAICSRARCRATISCACCARAAWARTVRRTRVRATPSLRLVSTAHHPVPLRQLRHHLGLDRLRRRGRRRGLLLRNLLRLRSHFLGFGLGSRSGAWRAGVRQLLRCRLSCGCGARENNKRQKNQGVSHTASSRCGTIYQSGKAARSRNFPAGTQNGWGWRRS